MKKKNRTSANMIPNTQSDKYLPIIGWGIELTKLAKDLNLTFDNNKARKLADNEQGQVGKPMLYKGYSIDDIFILMPTELPIRDDDSDSVVVTPTYSQVMEDVIRRTIDFFNNANESQVGEENRGAIDDYVNKRIGLISTADILFR